jgi:hypothetical protein
MRLARRLRTFASAVGSEIDRCVVPQGAPSCPNRASLHDGDVVYFVRMDVLRRDEIELARRTPEAQRGRQALDAMRMGFRLKRAALRTRYPEETEDAISARFRRWLAGDERP